MLGLNGKVFLHVRYGLNVRAGIAFIVVACPKSDNPFKGFTRTYIS